MSKLKLPPKVGKALNHLGFPTTAKAETRNVARIADATGCGKWRKVQESRCFY